MKNHKVNFEKAMLDLQVPQEALDAKGDDAMASEVMDCQPSSNGSSRGRAWRRKMDFHKKAKKTTYANLRVGMAYVKVSANGKPYLIVGGAGEEKRFTKHTDSKRVRHAADLPTRKGGFKQAVWDSTPERGRRMMDLFMAEI